MTKSLKFAHVHRRGLLAQHSFVSEYGVLSLAGFCTIIFDADMFTGFTEGNELGVPAVVLCLVRDFCPGGVAYD